MEDYIGLSSQQKEQQLTISRTFMTRVFSWMFMALAITAVTSFIFAANASLMDILVSEGRLSILGWIVMLAPLGLVLLLSAGINKLSPTAMILIFIAFSILMGMSLSFILLAYTGASVALTFVVTSSTFGIMALLGYTTKTDLTKFGSLLYMALFGMIIAMLINYFMHSSTMEYIISIAGVLIFTGLTAYDVQKLKRIGFQLENGEGTATKLSIMGALTLYLDFINLFLFLLRFLGNRR